MADNNKTGLLNKIITRRALTIILILGIGFIISVVIFNFLAGNEDAYIHCWIDKDINTINGPVTRLTEQDFIEHPTLVEWVKKPRNVLISQGLILDAYFWLNPYSNAHSAGSEGSQFIGNRVSPDEARILISNYNAFAYNGTVYRIAQPQCGC